jgi:indole-3-glycerol phosphate synthase
MSFLERIVKDVRERVHEELGGPIPERKNFGSHRSLTRSIIGCRRAPVISEIKPSSPSSGDLRRSLDPANIAAEMERGGAAGLSVVTEPNYFKGSMENLLAARRAVDLPILMKDFVVDERQIYMAAESGADAVLLMPAICELNGLYDAATECGLEALVEVHGPRDIAEAAKVGVEIVGVNNRDLKTFKVDIERTVELVPLIREQCGDVIVVSESGIASPEHVRYVLESGADAVLVGTSIMKAKDVEGKVRSLVGSV